MPNTDPSAQGPAAEHATADLSPLAWIHDELRKTLEGVHKALRRLVREEELRQVGGGADPALTSAALQAPAQALHQAAGALHMVQQDAAQRLVRAAEGLVRLRAGEGRFEADDLAVVERAQFALLTFVARSLAGSQPSPLALFPAYRAVQERAKAERAHPADFWPHHFDWKTLPRPEVQGTLPGIEALRTAFEAALLRHMREPREAHAAQLAELCGGLALAWDAEPRSSFWLLVAAHFEGQALGLLASDALVKRMASRLLAQLRAHAQGRDDIADRLVQDLLFFCAQCGDPPAGQGPLLRAVRSTYGLDEAPPDDYASDHLGRVDPAWVALGLRRVGVVKDAWGALSDGELARAEGLDEALGHLAQSLGQLFPDGGEVLAHTLQRAAAATLRSGSRPPAALAMEVASALLYVEASLEDALHEHPQEGERLRRLAERIQGAATGQAAALLEPWMEDLFRRVADRQTLGSVVHELRQSLADIEQAADRYFRAPTERDSLIALPGQLQAMRGVFSVLGLDQAALTCLRLRDEFDRLSNTEVDPSLEGPKALFERLATNLGQLGFLIDLLGVQPQLAKTLFRFDASSGNLVSSVGRERPVVASGAAVLAAEPVAALAADVTAEPGPEIAPAIAFDFAPVPGPAPVTADDLETRDGEPAAPDLPVLPATSALPWRDLADLDLPSLDLPELAPVEIAPAAPSPEAATAPALALDAELLPIFLEEAGEVLDTAAVALAQLQAAPGAREPLVVLRRAFHTLKGSSRMVQLAGYGEAAWAGEQLFNLRLERGVALTAAELDFAADAVRELAVWREALAQAQAQDATQAARHAERPAVTQTLRERADALRLDAPAPVSVPAPGEPRPAEAVEIELGLPSPSAPEQPLPAEDLPALELDLLSLDFGAEAVPAEAVAGETVSTEAVPIEAVSLEAAPTPDDTLRIDGLPVSAGLFQIFVEEAGAQAQDLQTALSQADALAGSVDGEAHTQAALALAHALAGNAATVGLEALSQLARALEHALERLHAAGLRDGLGALGANAADALRAGVAAFAQHRVEVPDPALHEALERFVPARLALPAEDEVLVQAAPPQGPSDRAQDVDAELWGIFEQEAQDLLERLHAGLRDWVQQPADASWGDACMRVLHTFKGGARLAGAARLGEQAHVLESDALALMAQAGRTREAVTRLQAQADALAQAFEAVCGAVGAGAGLDVDLGLDLDLGLTPDVPLVPDPVADAAPVLPDRGLDRTPAGAAQDPGPENVLEVPAPVSSLAPAPTADGTLLLQPADVAWPQWALADDPPTDRAEAGEAAHAQAAQALVRVRAGLLDRLAGQAGEVAIRRARLDNELSQMKASLADLDDNLVRLHLQLRDLEVQAEAQISSRQESTRSRGADFDPLEFDRYTRFQELTRLLAETVNDVAAVRRGLQRNLAQGEDELAAQSRLTRELQDDLLRARRVAFDAIGERLHRVVRQAAREAGKNVELVLEGQTAELDRSVLERLGGPLEHLLRNAVVHGIEAQAQREAAGKPAAGRLTLRVDPEGSLLRVSVTDDGAGLNWARLREKAALLDLLPEGRAPSEAELTELIFHPGVSTAQEVTEMAGRGVGMDVVRTELQALGGFVITRSQSGQGTQFELHVPQTTALTQILLLDSGGLRLALPAGQVDAVLHPPAGELAEAFQSGQFHTETGPVSLFTVGSLLGRTVGVAGAGASAGAVLLVHSGPRRAALHVDTVVGNQEVVLKKLGPQLRQVPGLAGISLLANGDVALIYNPLALVERYGERAHAVDRESAFGALPEAQTPVVAPLVLVVDDSLTVRRVTQRLLEREGYRVALAKDGADALEWIERDERPALVLSDVEMPRMDGFDLLRRLRGDARWRDLPVVMISSRTADKHRQFAEAQGVQGYLGKPYDEPTLLDLVRRHTQAAGA